MNLLDLFNRKITKKSTVGKELLIALINAALIATILFICFTSLNGYMQETLIEIEKNSKQALPVTLCCFAFLLVILELAVVVEIEVMNRKNKKS